MSIKVDSFPVNTNVHFPTDLNLLYDSGRKCIDIIKHLRKSGLKIEGWKHYKKWYGIFRKFYRVVSEIHRKKGKGHECRLLVAAKDYLEISERLCKKLSTTLYSTSDLLSISSTPNKTKKSLLLLNYYFDLLMKHIDLVHRRLILKESIPHSEKIFSIFEQHTKWITKGKLNRGINLGHNVLIASDQYNFILHARTYDNETDSQVTVDVGETIHLSYKKIGIHLSSISFDRNFFSKKAKKKLNKLYDLVVLPKSGYKSKAQKAEESSDIFIEKQKAHSGVEANISSLQQHGLKLCRDKGKNGFKRYVAYGVLSYNLHQLGRLVIEMQEQATQNVLMRA